MDENPVAELMARFERFGTTGDPGTLLDPQALDEAFAVFGSVDLAAAHHDETSAQEALQALLLISSLHALRAGLVPPAAAVTELQRWSAMVKLISAIPRPAGMPGHVRELLEALEGVQSAIDSGRPPSPDALARFFSEIDTGDIGPGLQALVTPPQQGGADDAAAANLRGRNLLLDFTDTGAKETLTEAVALLRRAVELAPPEDTERTRYLAELGEALYTWCAESYDPAALDEALGILRPLAARGAGDELQGGVLSALGNVLMLHFEQTNDAQVLEESLRALRQAVRVSPVPSPALLCNLSNPLMRKYVHRHDTDALAEALDVLRKAAELAAADDPVRHPVLGNLGFALLLEFERAGGLDTLDEGIAALRQALAASLVGNVYRVRYAANLINLLVRRFESVRDTAALDEAIALGRDTAQALPHDHPGRSVPLSGLGNALLFRSAATESSDALDEAIRALREAVDIAPPGHSDLPMWQGNLANALVRHYELTQDHESLEEAVAMRRRAVAALGATHARHPMALANLGGTLTRHFTATANSSSLSEATSVLREAVRLTAAEDPSRPVRLAYLGRTLALSGDPVSNRQAADIFRQAIDIVPNGHRIQAQCLSGLATCLFRTGDRDARIRAFTLFRAASRLATAPTVERAQAALDWAQFALQIGDRQGALEGSAAAVGLLDLVAWRGIGRRDQERLLRRFAGVATDAGALAIEAGRPEFAVELLEQGRAVLLAQALDTRTGLQSLLERAPELAERLVAIDEELERPDADAFTADPGLAATQAGHREADRRIQLAREREALLTQVRALPGLADFLLPPQFNVLRIAAARGPVVIVNTSRHGCHGLIVTMSGVHVTPLTGISHADIGIRVRTFIDAVAKLAHPDHDFLRARQAIIDTLAWMWATIAEPILSDLGLTRRFESAPEHPRIWWCATGLLSFLPLHAAGRHATRHDAKPATVLDRVISSYTPTLRTLLPAQGLSGGAVDGPLAVVAMPVTPGEPDLPAAPREVSTLRELFPRAAVFEGQAATRGAVLAALGRSTYVHFACHGSQDLGDPSRGRLSLHDGPLTIRDISRQRLTNAELAFLSACDTSRGGDELADEAITLAAAAQIAGYRHVIGCLWSMSDSLAPQVAHRTYTRLSEHAPGRLDVRGTAHALHDAIRALREEYPRAPALWAAYVHLGP